MATTHTTRNLLVVGVLFAAAGAFQALAVLFGWLPSHPGGAALFALSNIAFAVAFILLAARRVGDALAQAAFWVAGVGWAILALTTVLPLGPLGTIGLVVALVGSIGAGLAVFIPRLFAPLASTVFVIGMVLGALNLLNALAGFLGPVGGIVTFAFGVAVLIAGIFIAQRK